MTEHARRLRALEASMAALRDQAGRAASGAEVADLASRLDGAREALEAADETAGRVAELQARLGALSRAVKGIQEEAASKEDLRPLAHLPGTLSSLTQEVGRLGTLGRKLDVEVTRLGSDVRRLNAVKADKGEGGGAQAPMDAPGGTERGPDDGGAAAGDIGSGFGGDWAEAAAEMREELGRAIGDMERQLGDAKKSVLETAYAVLLLTAGRRVDRHTARPGVGPGGDTDRGAGDLGVEDLPGGAGAQGTDGPVLSPLELLGDMLDRDMVHEKADKDALKRLADWVDEREATRAGAVSPEKLSVEDSAAEKDGRGADVRGEASVASVRGNGVADKTALDGARGADGADGMWAEQVRCGGQWRGGACPVSLGRCGLCCLLATLCHCFRHVGCLVGRRSRSFRRTWPG